MLHCGDDLMGHIPDDLIGITVWHQAGKRPSTCHAVSAGVVNHDQIDATRFFALGTDSCTRATTNNGQSLIQLFSKAF